MNPRPFGLRSAYPLFVLLAVAAGIAVLIPAARRVRFPLPRLLLIEAVVIVAGLVGAVLYNLIEVGALHRFGWGALFSSGLRYPGGLIAIVLVLPIIALLLPRHVSLLGFLDLIAPSAAIAMAVMRGGCFMMGCCYGLPSDLPWALSYPPASQVARHHALTGWIDAGAWSLPVHPLHLYFGLASLAVGVFLWWFQPRKSYDGQVVLLYLALHEGAKGLLEFLRGSLPDHPVGHLRVVSLTVAALATAVLLARVRGWAARPAPGGSTPRPPS